MATCYSHLSSFALTDVGHKRKNNEDAYQMYPEHGVFIVADGMGGAEDGEVASKAIVDELTKTLKGFDPAQPLSCPAMQAWICHSVNEASAWILKRSNDRNRAGTGSTFVGVCFDPEHPDRVVALHAGDSRVYRVRGGDIQQVTRDHSLANAAGITDERELNPKFRGVILRAVGLAVTTEVEATPFDVAEGDTVIVCSDGLSKMIEDAAIAKIVEEEAELEVSVRKLIDAALTHGGKDNVTVIAVKVGPLPEPLPVTELKVAFPTDFGHSKTDSNPTPQTPIDVNASPATQQTDYRTPLAPVSFDKPLPPPNRKRMPVLLIVIIALVIAALCGAGLGLFFKMQEKKAAEAMEKVHEEARQSALQQIRLAEEAEVKKQAEAEARRLQEEASQKEAARLKAEEEVRKVEAERKAEEERLKLEAQKAEELRQQALEEQRKAEEAAVKAAAEKKALAARKKAEAEQKLALERQRIEAERQRLVAEKQKAEEEATRLAAAVAAGNGDTGFTEREKAVLHLVRLAKQEAQAKAYCTFMVLHATKNMETTPLVTNYDQARQALVQWSDNQILTAQKLKQLTEEQLAPIHNYARALSVFLSTNAVELYAKRTRMKDPAKKIWERLAKESGELKSLAMDSDSTRLRLVQLVETLSAEAK
jgi:serine/threonine protein phosphatase PrpC